MLTVTFAFCVATALFFLFRQTRWMGVVGVFVLLCINPLFFIGLLLLLGCIGYWAFGRPSIRTLSSDPLLPRDERARRSRRGLLVLGVLGIGGALALATSGPEIGGAIANQLQGVRSTPSEEVIVLRTPGGLLEVSTLHATEIIDARVPHRLFGLDVGELVPRIRLPATYRYHVELAPEWRVLRTEGVFTVVAPRIKPSLPVAFDTQVVERDVSGGWWLVPWKGRADLADLERSITAKLAQKASSKDYLERQRASARATVKEFARKWLIEQTPWKFITDEDVRVYFADETAGALAAFEG